jgi:hypothetical protein
VPGLAIGQARWLVAGPQHRLGGIPGALRLVEDDQPVGRGAIGRQRIVFQEAVDVLQRCCRLVPGLAQRARRVRVAL